MSRSDFWSRRRAKVAAEDAALAKSEAAAEDARAQKALEEKTDAEILAELDLPDPDQMEKGDDFSVFLKAAIPERLKRRALRRLWTTNPVLANLDGLIDYGDDFTDAATVVENLSTTYQVGKGLTRHVEEMLRQKMKAEGGAEEDVPQAEPTPEEAPEMPEESPIIAESEELAEIPDHIDQEPENRISYARPGRMRYRFD